MKEETTKSKNADMIIVDVFGEVLVELVLAKKISTDVYLYFLSETKKRITKAFADELKRKTEELKKEMLETAIHITRSETYEQKN